MARIDEVQIGRKARKALIVKFDVRKIERGCWGIFRWRFFMAVAFVRMAQAVLGCKCEIIPSGEEAAR